MLPGRAARLGHVVYELVQREKRVTSGGKESRRPRDEWVYEVHRFWNVEMVDWTPDRRPILEEGWVYLRRVQEDGTVVHMPDVFEVPHYTSNADDALGLKHSVIGFSRTR